MMEIGTLAVLAGIVFILVLGFKGIKIVNQSQCMVIERFGRYSETLQSGLNFIIPIMDKPRPMIWMDQGYMFGRTNIDLRESVLDVEKQAVITKDNVSIDIDAILYIQLTDPIKAMYEIENLPLAVGQLAQTSLRNVIGEMDLDETLASRDVINSKLKAILDDATDKWGTKVNRVEIKNIMPPKDIQNAMEKQMQAERERRAQVLEAEGDKQSRIARSEGLKQEQINIAEGERDATIKRAEGEAEAVRQVAHAKMEAVANISKATGNAELTTQFLVASRYLETLEKFEAQAGDKIYIPYEASSALGALGSIKEMMSPTEK